MRTGFVWLFVVHSFLSAFPSAFLSAGTDNNGRGTKAIALANSFVAVADNAWAVAYNPAGLSFISQFQLSAFVVNEQFGLPELRTNALAATLPFSSTTIGFSLERFGFDLYNENVLRIGTGFRLDAHTAAGITLSLDRLSIKNYGTASLSTIDVGLLASILENIRLGFTFENVTASTAGQNRETLPQVFHLGVVFALLQNLILTSEIEKDTRFPMSLKMGVEEVVFEHVAVRVGVANNPDKFSVGTAISYAPFEFSYAAYSHPDLGWTHQIEMTVKFNE